MTQLANISLVAVPCWWDGGVASLASTIGFQRPDLIPNTVDDPITLNPHNAFFPGSELPDVGEIMLASFPLSSSTDFVDTTSWWMGEKYDGVRFCWNPNQSTVYTRHGKELTLALDVQDSLPHEFIDGEFWFGRGAFSATYPLCKGSTYIVHWHVMRAVSFDVPAPAIHSLSFEERYSQLLDAVDYNHPIVVVAPRVACEGSEHLSRAVGEIIEGAGEGSILRLMGSRYIPGRSDSLIKFKAANADKEGLVIDVEGGTVTLKLPNGQVFEVPPHNVHIPTPSKGEVVTFSYEINARREMPVSPIINRTRNDVEWEDLLNSDANEQSYLIDKEAAQTKIFTAHPIGFWTHANMRAYMENLARSFDLDPLKSDTWINIPFKSVSQSKSGRVIMQKFGGYSAALKSLFPEVDLEGGSPHHLWSSIEHRRKFFENYANANAFNPYNAENWYSQHPQRILAQQGASRVMFYHGYSVSRALLDLFPDIGLDKSKLGKWSWQYSVNRRQFFETYAADNNFDPLVADNWYRQSREQIMSTGAAPFVVLYHNHMLAQSLLDLFPDVALDRLKLLYLFDSRHMVNGRKFFEDYAKSNGFDPLNPDNWYIQSLKNIIVHEGARKILIRHESTLSVALLELFPDIGLEKAYFNKLPLLHKRAAIENVNRAKANGVHPSQTKSGKSQSSHNNEPNGDVKSKEKKTAHAKVQNTGYTKQFFVSYAKQNGFDSLVPENWYSQSRTQIIATQGAAKAVAKFKGSVSKALLVTFPDIGLIKSKLWASLWNELKSRRKLFETYARRNDFDPLVPENWYSIDAKSLVSDKGFLDVIMHHKDSVTQALSDLFPEIGLEKSKMSSHSVWQDASTRRRYFENYAKERGFDPLDAQGWLSHSQEKILAAKGAVRVVSYHQGKVSKALVDLFPDIGLHKSSFWSRTSLQLLVDRRKYFESYARENEFDPLIATNWYAHKDRLLNTKGIGSVLRYHNTSIAKALSDLFPNIGLDSSLLRTGPSWPDKEGRRKVFESYAADNGFDPHNPESWYSHPKFRISAQKGGFMTMVYYKGSVQNALLDLFPDIGMELSKIQSSETMK